LSAHGATLAPGVASLGICFEGVAKRFGPLTALREISLEIGAGEFVALLGPNGAGKTTLLRIAALLMNPSSGNLRFTVATGAAQQDLPLEQAKPLLGMVAHNSLLYDELTASENLTFFAQLYGLEDVRARVLAALETCGLGARAQGIVRAFSRGMRQRLTIARALLHGPRLLLLDEPAAGLDHQGLAWLAVTLARLRDGGCTILMSTHARNESLELATRAVSLAGGRIAHDTGLRGDVRPLLAALQGAEA